MKRIVQFVTCLLILICGVSSGYAQITLSSKAKSLVGIEVYFRFDKSELDINYMGNRDALARFTHVVDSIGYAMIDSIVVVSQSSPEGPYWHNMRLSEQRSATMRRAIERRHPELKELLRVHPDGESWKQLREYVVKDTVMDRASVDEVLSVIDSNVSITTKKQRMSQLPVYEYLYKTYYPRIRNSVFCIVYYDLPVYMASPHSMFENLATIDSLANLLADSIAPIPMVIQPVQHCEPVLNVRTNLLYDLGTVANIGVEYYFRNHHWSLAGHYTFPWWRNDQNHYYMQLLDLNLEARYYFSGKKPHAGHYLSAYTHANLYDFSFDAERAWQGEGWGVGLGYGYVWQPWRNKNWKLEAFVRFGYYHSFYDPYHAGDPFNGKYYYDWDGPIEDFMRRNHRLRWVGPTGVGVTLSYDLFSREVKQKQKN